MRAKVRARGIGIRLMASIGAFLVVSGLGARAAVADVPDGFSDASATEMSVSSPPAESMESTASPNPADSADTTWNDRDGEGPNVVWGPPSLANGPEYVVRNLHVVSFGEGTAQIGWDSPEVNWPESRHAHRITLNGTPVEECDARALDLCALDSRTSYTLHGLNPGATYTVTVEIGFIEVRPVFTQVRYWGEAAELTFIVPGPPSPGEHGSSQTEGADILASERPVPATELAATGGNEEALLPSAVWLVIAGTLMLASRRRPGRAGSTGE